MGISEKNNVLFSIADALRENTDFIMQANVKDLENGKRNGMSKALLDRLALSPSRIEGMAEGLESVAKLQDPVGEVMGTVKRPNGLYIGKKACAAWRSRHHI